MKVKTYFSAAPQRTPTPGGGRLAISQGVKRYGGLRDFEALAGEAKHGACYGEADAAGLRHGYAEAKRMLQVGTDGGLSLRQLEAARLVRVQLHTAHPALAVAAPLPPACGWVRIGAALGVQEGRTVAVWAWAVPRAAVTENKPTRSSTPSDDGWEDT